MEQAALAYSVRIDVFRKSEILRNCINTMCRGWNKPRKASFDDLLLERIHFFPIAACAS